MVESKKQKLKMISTYKVLGFLYLIMEMVTASPVPLAENNGFADFLRKAQLNAPSEGSFMVKRDIFKENGDKQLKEISLSSLIGDLEKSLFASALSVNKIFINKDVSVPEVEVIDEEVTTNSEKITTAMTAELTTTLPATDKVILQTTEKAPESNGIPTHIVIDRIAIQPHTDGLTLIPIFELKHTKKDEDDNKDDEVTKITVSKTEITSLTTAAPETSTNSTTSSTTTEAHTTPKNIEQLKDAEEELKEKFAEIEAEPLIFSARV